MTTELGLLAMAEVKSDAHVAVVGGGLVGCLAAISFARQGYTVDIYESRSDPRKARVNQGRSINLAVSARGLGAIRSIDTDLHQKIEKGTLPMKGRMIHACGRQESQIYGLFGECIRSIDRAQLNVDLLNEALRYTNVTAHFEHRLQSANFDGDGRLRFRTQDGDSVEVPAKLTVGCDGANSTVRSIAMKVQRMNFAQEYIDHAYLELAIPAASDGTFALDCQHLHIWPRQEFMLIALPNPDKSFTSTLFAPQALFDSLSSAEKVLSFFERQFPDALELIGREALIQHWKSNPVSSLVQVKCTPCHYKDKVILLGDSTHAMVPFYGQGMNCGFEDVRILGDILLKHKVHPRDMAALGVALAEYTEVRSADLAAILQLAMGNYEEMRSKVTSSSYLWRKRLDAVLGRLFRDRWIPMYSMVSFHDDIPYSQVIARESWQSKVLHRIATCTTIAVVIGTTFALYRHVARQEPFRRAIRSGLLSLADSV